MLANPGDICVSVAIGIAKIYVMLVKLLLTLLLTPYGKNSCITLVFIILFVIVDLLIILGVNFNLGTFISSFKPLK